MPAKRTPTLGWAVIPLLAIAAFLAVGCGLLRIDAAVPLIAAAAAAGGVAARLGLTWTEMQAGIVQSIARGLPPMLIVVVVGALIGSWLAAWTIPMIIHYGLGLISPRGFLVTASLVSCLVSLLTGTSYGTVGTIGVAFMGIARGLGIPPGQAAGALVAGAYFGDKMSPFSETTNLAAAAARVNLYDHIRHMLWTTTPALLLGLGVYGFLGWWRPGAALALPTETAAIRAAIAGHFRFSAWLLLPPAITVGSVLCRWPVIPGMLLSIAVAVVLGIQLQHVPTATALNILVGGYRPATGYAPVDRLLAQGGMLAMMRVTLIAICAFAFSGLLQAAGLFDPLLSRLLRFARSPGRLIAATVAACIGTAMLTGSSFLSILIPGELLAPAYQRLNLAAKNLSRTTDDSGTVVVPLIPWSIAGLYMSTTLGVPVVEYAPWAVFCYTGFIFALIYGFTGFAVAARLREDETQPGS